MSPDHAAIQDKVLHVWITDKMLMHVFPDFVFAPSGKAFVDAIPLAVHFRQQAPLGPAASNPEHGFKEKTTVGFLSSVNLRMILQEGIHFVPFIFSKSYV
jgi:hypothetical protein